MIPRNEGRKDIKVWYQERKDTKEGTKDAKDG